MEYVIRLDFFCYWCCYGRRHTNTGWQYYFFFLHLSRFSFIALLSPYNTHTCKWEQNKQKLLNKKTKRRKIESKKDNNKKKAWKKAVKKAQSIVKLNGTKSLNRIENALPFLVNSMNWISVEYIYLYIEIRERERETAQNFNIFFDHSQYTFNFTFTTNNQVEYELTKF